MKALNVAALVGTVVLAAAACHSQRLVSKPPAHNIAPSTSAAVETGEPRAMSGDPSLTQTTSAEFRSEEMKPTPPPQPKREQSEP